MSKAIYRCSLNTNLVRKSKCYKIKGHENCSVNRQEQRVKPVHNGNYLRHGNLIPRIVPVKSYIGVW